jgi:hypothetical protein
MTHYQTTQTNGEMLKWALRDAEKLNKPVFGSADKIIRKGKPIILITYSI